MKCGLLNILLLTLLFYGECAAASIQRSTHYTTADGLSHNSVQGFCIDSSGMLWICSWFALERFDGYSFESFRPEEPHEFSRFKTAYLSDDDQILVTTNSGRHLTFSLKDYTFQNCEDAPCERGERFRRSLTDTYGNRWEEANVGVWFTPHEATDYTLIQHEKYRLPRLFFEDSEARLWISWGGPIGTKERGGELVCYDQAGLELKSFCFSSAVYAMYEDGAHNLWLGTRADGLVILKPDGRGEYTTYRYRPEEREGALSHNKIFDIQGDSLGRVWIATLGGGVQVVERGYDVEHLSFHVPIHYPLQYNPRARSLLETDEAMLIGTDDGLLKTEKASALDAMRFVNLSDQAGAAMPARELIHLTACADGKILLSSFGKGIYAFDNATDTFQPYVADDIASKQAVYSMLEGEEGDLWVVAQTDHLHYDKDLQRAIKPISESLTMIETRPLSDRQGYRWFATTEGALRLNKEYPAQASQSARAVRFTELTSHQTEAAEKRLLTMADSVLRLNAKERTITLAVSAMRYGQMERIRYAWRMEGVQQEWVAFDRPNELMLHDLKPGRWVLEVRSTDGSDRWLDNAGQIVLDVAFLWYETNTARGLFGLLLFVAVVAVVWLLLRFKKLQSMYDRLLNSQLMVAVQTSMTELKPEESLTEADRQFIERLNQKIGEGIDNADFSIDALAATFNMSRSVFYRRLKSVVGQSPVEYLKEYRLQYATELLLQDAEKTVAMIAYESGFSSPQYFSNVFRKRFHMTPNEWRKGHLTKKYNQKRENHNTANQDTTTFATTFNH